MKKMMKLLENSVEVNPNYERKGEEFEYEGFYLTANSRAEEVDCDEAEKIFKCKPSKYCKLRAALNGYSR